MEKSKKLLIVGGRGALGSALVNHFKSIGYSILSIDHGKNDSAHLNILIDQSSMPLMEQQAESIEKKLLEHDKEIKFNGIICVAGGWAGGNASDENFLKNADLMWKQSVQPSLLTTFLATKFLKEKGLLVLTGANAALEPTPGMIGYGMAKAAVHNLIQSLGSEGNGLPKDAKAFAILPVTLDTPNNRKSMPDADLGSWTPLSDIAQLIQTWLEELDFAPKSGSLICITTKDGKTATEIN